MAFEFTEDQKKAINAKGTVLVAAAAGSGKTAVLTKRVISRICDPSDPATIDRLLIVTFTNASALEMRIRIAKALDEACAKNPGNTYILKQKLLLQSAKICTIDSFCIELVRQNFGTLGVSPNFSIGSNAETSALKSEALKNVLAPRFAAPTNAFRLLCETFGIYDGDDRLQEAIQSTYDFLMCLSRPNKWLKDAENRYRVEDIENCEYAEIILKKVITKLSDLDDSLNLILREAIDSEYEAGITAYVSDATEYSKTVKSFVKQGPSAWDTLYDALLNYKPAVMPSKKKGVSEELYEKLKEMRNKHTKSFRSIADDMCGPASTVVSALNSAGAQVSEFTSLLSDFTEEYRRLLDSRNILTFSLVEQLALQLLCDETEEGLVPSKLSKEICTGYEEVLVDEYQDNNDLQDALFFAISDGGKRLFTVGDVKQCIYAFRNADPINFLKRKNEYPLYDGNVSPSKVILSSNFRSRKGVCNFINNICRSIMQKETCDLEYNSEEALIPDAKFPENNAPAAEITITDAGNNNRDIADAESVADYIESVLKEDAFLRDGDVLRKADFGDFAILLRYPKTRGRYYAEALKKRGIPTLYDSGFFYESPEILSAVSILKVIDNPTRDIPLLSAVTSVAFGFSFDNVAEIKTKYNGNNLYSRIIAASNDGNEKCKNFLDTVSRLRTAAVTMPVSHLIKEMYGTTFLQELMSSTENGIQRRNNLNKLCNMAAEYEKTNLGGLSGFLNYFERSAADGSLGDKAPQTNVNAVRIMSFHGSKGLQFPITVVAGLGGGFNQTDLNKPIIINSEYGIGLKFFNGNEKTETIAHRVLRFTEQQKMIAEEIRLLYVAMTRAEERLMLSITSSDYQKDIENSAEIIGLGAVSQGIIPASAILSSKGPKKFILAAALLQKSGDNIAKAGGVNPIGYNGEGDFKFILSHKISEQPDITKENIADNTVAYRCDSEVKAWLDQRFMFEYPNKESDLPTKIAVTELVHEDKSSFAFKSRPRFMSKAGLTPAERGTALHKVMQYADYSNAEADLEAELSRLYEYEFIREDELEAINRSSLVEFFNSDLYRRMKQANKILREYKFMINHPYKDGEVIVQGIADCIFFESEMAVIVDFKTDNVNNMSVLSERYSKQLQIYKKAVAEIFGLDNIECIIYSMHLSKSIEV